MNGQTILWFRHDLRIQDNPALATAINTGQPVLPVFIHAPAEEADWQPGAASNWWLHHALESLRDELGTLNLPLIIRSGASLDVLQELIGETDATAVFWNRRYEPAVIKRDSGIKKSLRRVGIETRSFNAALLFEPHQISNKSGSPFRVFTPFWKHLLRQSIPAPVHVDTAKAHAPAQTVSTLALDDLGLLPDLDWDKEFSDYWSPGLSGANTSLDRFIKESARDYREQRDLPGTDGTSRLSPYLHFGQLGPRQVFRAAQQAGVADTPGGHTFLSEVAWREFAHHLLFHFPHTSDEALNPAYSKFPWEPDADLLKAWQTGMTGYPVVDAGMRELWRTGWMHNRVRMITASFLVKHLLQPWQSGARWFWDTLLDADLASNSMGWQWVAGSGADASPYFRIFNPILQGEKFDQNGDYVRHWIPELKMLPAKWLHQPWEAPAQVLQEAGIKLGADYPLPVIGHRQGRERALSALAENKARNRSETTAAGDGK